MSDQKCKEQTELTETDDLKKRTVQIQESLEEPSSGKEGSVSRAWSRQIPIGKIGSEEKDTKSISSVAENQQLHEDQGRRVNPNSVPSEKKVQNKTEVASKSTRSGSIGRGSTGQPRALKQASSTSTIAETAEQRDPLNVKRVSSSNDVSRAYKTTSAQRYRGRVNTPGAGRGAGRGGWSGRRRGSETDGGRQGDGGRVGEQRHSIQDGGIRLPPQRGGKGPNTIQNETDGGLRVSGNHNQKKSVNSVQQTSHDSGEQARIPSILCPPSSHYLSEGMEIECSVSNSHSDYFYH